MTNDEMVRYALLDFAESIQYAYRGSGDPSAIPRVMRACGQRIRELAEVGADVAYHEPPDLFAEDALLRAKMDRTRRSADYRKLATGGLGAWWRRTR